MPTSLEEVEKMHSMCLYFNGSKYKKFNIWRLVIDVMCSSHLTDPNLLNQQDFQIQLSGQISCCFLLMQKFGSDLT